MNIQNKGLAVFPYIEEFNYSEQLSSEKLNKQFASLQESVLRALIRSQEINSSLNILESAVTAQSTSITSLYNKLQYTNLTNTNNIYITSFSNHIQSNNNVSYDTAYGYTTLKIDGQFSKIPRSEKYDNKISPNVTITLNGEIKPYDSSIYRILDNSLNTLWFEQLSENDLNEKGEVELEIQLPPALTKRFNYIRIDPFPLFGFDIVDIQFQDLYSEYQSIKENLYGTHKPLGDSGIMATPAKFYISPREYNGSIKIIAKPYTTRYFGFSNIDIGFTDFNNTSQNFVLQFDGFKATPRPKSIKITDVLIDYYFDSSDIISAESLIKSKNIISAKLVIGMYDPNTNVLTNTNAVQPIPLIINNKSITINKNITLNANEGIYLDVTFTEFNMTTPVIRGAKLTYKDI